MMNLPIFKLFAAGSSSCSFNGLGHSVYFLLFPTWYEYLPGHIDSVTGRCSPQLTGIDDVWLIIAAIIDILLRLAALLAVIFIIYGSVQYITSQGSPERTDQARKTIISAVIGLVIAVTAAVIVSFIARRLLGGS